MCSLLAAFLKIPMLAGLAISAHLQRSQKLNQASSWRRTRGAQARTCTTPRQGSCDSIIHMSWVCICRSSLTSAKQYGIGAIAFRLLLVTFVHGCALAAVSPGHRTTPLSKLARMHRRGMQADLQLPIDCSSSRYAHPCTFFCCRGAYRLRIWDKARQFQTIL